MIINYKIHKLLNYNNVQNKHKKSKDFPYEKGDFIYNCNTVT